MAEVRKFKQGDGGQIAEAIAKAMGEGVRPTTPGAPPSGGEQALGVDHAGDEPGRGRPTSTQGLVTASSFFGTDPRFTVPAPAADAPGTDADAEED